MSSAEILWWNGHGQVCEEWTGRWVQEHGGLICALVWWELPAAESDEDKGDGGSSKTKPPASSLCLTRILEDRVCGIILLVPKTAIFWTKTLNASTSNLLEPFFQLDLNASVTTRTPLAFTFHICSGCSASGNLASFHSPSSWCIFRCITVVLWPWPILNTTASRGSMT